MHEPVIVVGIAADCCALRGEESTWSQVSLARIGTGFFFFFLGGGGGGGGVGGSTIIEQKGAGVFVLWGGARAHTRLHKLFTPRLNFCSPSKDNVQGEGGVWK